MANQLHPEAQRHHQGRPSPEDAHDTVKTRHRCRPITDLCRMRLCTVGIILAVLVGLVCLVYVLVRTGALDNRQSVPELTSGEQQSLRRHISSIRDSTPSEPVSVDSQLITATDIWVGTRYDGLYRYDRATGFWHSYSMGGAIGTRIARVWCEEDRVWVDHATWANHIYSYVDYSDDRGLSWTRFIMGGAECEGVHAPHFTNQGFRTELLSRIIEALKLGVYPEEIVTHMNVDREIYFTLYVNAAVGWCALYRYDVKDDRLTDLTITTLDPGAVGVRAYHLDPFNPRLLWILGAGYGGAFQTPRAWYLYDRHSRVTHDTNVRYAGVDDYVSDDVEYFRLIVFEANRVSFLGRKDDADLEVVGVYDRTTRMFSFP